MKSNNLKRAAALGLAALMLAPSVTFAKEFKDVKKNNKYSWAYNAIDTLSDKNIISGHPDGEFKPGDSVSLEELLQLIKQVLNPSDKELKDAKEKYSKIARANGSNTWSEEAICLALDRGYLDESALKKAYERGFFKIDSREYPSRGDIAIFFARALNLNSKGNTNLLKHKDQNKMSETLKGYLASLIDANIFTSTGSDGNFEGDRPITRAETAIITKASFDYAEKNTISAKTEKKKGTVVLSSKLNNVNVIIIESNNQKYSFDLDANTKFKLKDKDLKLEDIKAGQEVEIEYVKANSGDREGTAKTVNVTNAMLDMVGYVNSKGNNQITLRYRSNSDTLNFRTTSKISTSDTKTFDLDTNVKIKAYGKDLKLEDLATDDLVEFKTNNDNKITEMTVYPKEAQIKGRVISVDTSNKDKAKLKIRLKDNKDYELYITNETKDLDKITLNDDVNLYLNYKVVRGLAYNYQKNTTLIGVIKDYSDQESSGAPTYRSNYYIDFEEENGNRRIYNFAYNIEIYKDSDLKSTSQIRRSDIIGRSAIIELDNNGDVRTIRLISSDSKFSGMLQVINTNHDYAFDSYVTNTVELKVIQTNNRRLDNSTTFKIQNTKNYDRFAVISCDGFIDSDGKIQALFNVREEKNPGKELQSYRYDGYLRKYSEVLRDNNARDNNNDGYAKVFD